MFSGSKMKTTLALALGAGLSALALAASIPALAGGYWDGAYAGPRGDESGSYRGDGYCPPPPPPPCDCPERHVFHDQGFDDQGLALSSLFEDGLDGGVGGGPGVENGDFGDGGGGVFIGGPTGFGFAFGGPAHFSRFHDGRFIDHGHVGFSSQQQQHVSVSQRVMVQSHASQRSFSHGMMGGHGRW
jgi:hypothetical protein